MDRPRWGSRANFILAAVGAAIGLGNVWRFPYIAVENGGGAFLVPYFVALITIGVPVMTLEYGLGARYQTSLPGVLRQLKKRSEVVGWMAILTTFVVAVYYSVVISWVAQYLFVQGAETWGTMEASGRYFNESVLKKSATPWDGLLSVRWPIAVGLLLVWAAMYWILRKGLNRVSRVILYTVPLPIGLLVILLVRGVTLEGAALGLNHYLEPDWQKLLDPKVWMAAYGQIFFSLGIGMAIMVTYASFMKRDAEIPNSARITALSNCTFSFIAGFAVFSVLGYFAFSVGKPIEELSTGGIGLAFVVYPTALVALPFWAKFFAFMFFLMLVLLGIDSAFSMVECVSASLVDKFGTPKGATTLAVIGLGFLLGYPFITRSGLYWLDIVDHYVLERLVPLNVILQIVLINRFLKLRAFTAELNVHAELKIGGLFRFLIRVLIPVMLVALFAGALVEEFRAPYGGYAPKDLLVIGLVPIGLVVVGAVVLSRMKSGARPPVEEGL